MRNIIFYEFNLAFFVLEYYFKDLHLSVKICYNLVGESKHKTFRNLKTTEKWYISLQLLLEFWVKFFIVYSFIILIFSKNNPLKRTALSVTENKYFDKLSNYFVISSKILQVIIILSLIHI